MKKSSKLVKTIHHIYRMNPLIVVNHARKELALKLLKSVRPSNPLVCIYVSMAMMYTRLQVEAS